MTNDALIESTIRWLHRMYRTWPYALGLPGGYPAKRFCLWELPPPMLDLTAPLQPAREIEVLMFDFRSPDRRWGYRMQSTSAWLPVEPTTNEQQGRWLFTDMPAPGERWRLKGKWVTYIIREITVSHVLIRNDLPIDTEATTQIPLVEFLQKWERA